jgi:hypothetical protein
MEMAVLARACWLFVGVSGMVATFFNSFYENLNILASVVDTESVCVLVV